MAGVNQSFARCFIVFIVICILLEGALYLGLSAWGLTVKSCFVEKITPIQLDAFSSFKLITQLVYFNDKSQCNIILTLEDGVQIEFLSSEKTTPVTARTNILLIVYACVSGMWMLTSILALVGLCKSFTKKTQLICFLPFLLSVIAGCILDITASVFFGIDISNTMSFDNAMKYLGISYKITKDGIDVNPSEDLDFKTLNSFMFVPSVIMICLSSRVILIFILNMIGAFFVFSLSKQLIDPFENKQNIQHFASERPVANPQVQRLNSRNEVPPPTLPKPNQAHEPFVIKEEFKDQKEIQRAISYEPSEIRTLEPFKYIDHDDGVHEIRRSVSPVPIPIRQRISRQHSNRLNKEQYNEPPSPINLSIHQQLSSDSPLNYRYSMHDFNENDEGHNGEEKFGQLPWSYSKDLGDVLKARQQIMTNPNRNSDMPIIPVPDYTIHPNRKNNGNTTFTNVNYGN